METGRILVSYPFQGVISITLNRPDKHNAFDELLVRQLIDQLNKVDQDPNIRVVLLSGKGKNFSAGADLEWMHRMSNYTMKENIKDATTLMQLFRTLDNLSKPTIALVQGVNFGGGVGLVACCDVVIAASSAVFRFSEVRIGLIPATIAPYVIAAIGPRAARRYFLTAEQFTAKKAQHMGLVHKVVADDMLFEMGHIFALDMMHSSPASLAAAKKLIRKISPIDDQLLQETAKWIAEVRISPEGKEGIAAFLEKRKPNWVQNV